MSEKGRTKMTVAFSLENPNNLPCGADAAGSWRQCNSYPPRTDTEGGSWCGLTHALELLHFLNSQTTV